MLSQQFRRLGLRQIVFEAKQTYTSREIFSPRFHHIKPPLRPQALLGHPLCLTLLHFKWHGLARYLYYINLLLYITFLTFLTGYVISTPPPNAYADRLAESV